MAFIGLHIHKTAGTSLLRYLERHAPLRLYGAYALRNYRLLELPLWVSPNFTSRDIFWGHTIYESFFYEAAEPIRLFTFLRNPHERIVSWYSMLRRRKKLTTSAINLETFAKAHSNSICRMLIDRFPSLITTSSASLADQAMSVLDMMGFVGFQEHYTEQLPLLLDWMKVPVCSKTMHVRHNTAKKTLDISKEVSSLLEELNDQDLLLYAWAYDRYGKNPLHPERQWLGGSLPSSSNINRDLIRTRQIKTAQKKFISSLSFSLGYAGVESYIRTMKENLIDCENLLSEAINSRKCDIDHVSCSLTMGGDS